MLATDWSSVFTALSASAAAIAAIAAWATVYVEHRARWRAREPVLSITVISIMEEGFRDRITIENEGGGLARGVSFIVANLDTRDVCMGPLPPTGTLAAGQRVILAAGYPGRSENRQLMAAAICQSGSFLLAWNIGGQHTRYRLRWRLIRWGLRSAPSPQDMFRRLYSDAPDVTSLRFYAYAVEAVEG